MTNSLPPDPENPPKPERSSKDLATVGDVTRAAAGEKFVAWLSSGLGALASVLGIAVILSGGVWFTIDRSEAKGAEGGQKGVDAAAQVQRNLEAHERFEAEHHHWTEQMLFRQDQKSDTVILGLGLRNPAPYAPPPPPKPDLPKDGGP